MFVSENVSGRSVSPGAVFEHTGQLSTWRID